MRLVATVNARKVAGKHANAAAMAVATINVDAVQKVIMTIILARVASMGAGHSIQIGSANQVHAKTKASVLNTITMQPIRVRASMATLAQLAWTRAHVKMCVVEMDTAL
jgi:hypothetical protein